MYCAYHWSWCDKENEGIKIVETEEELQKLLSTGEWFDSPIKAWEFYFLFKNPYWTVKQACFLLARQNPWSANQKYSNEAQMIYAQLNTAYQAGEIKLIEMKNIDQETEIKGENVVFIKFALKANLSIPDSYRNFLSSTSKTKDLLINSHETSKIMSALGKKGADKKNEQFTKHKKIALKIARKAWKHDPTRTKEDVVALVLAEFQTMKIYNGDSIYSSDTIEQWIKNAMPSAKKKGGRPRKNPIKLINLPV